MHWKGSITSTSQLRKRIYATFYVAHAGHLFFVAKDTTANIVSIDTVLKPYYGTMNWLRSVGFCKHEFGISIEFDTNDSLADCEISTDYFGLTFRFNNSGIPTPVQRTPAPKMHDELVFRPLAKGGVITFDTDKPCVPIVSIHSLSGAILYQSASRIPLASRHTLHWNGCDRKNRSVLPGAYVISVKMENTVAISKAIILR
jgi:hypothetical protein